MENPQKKPFSWRQTLLTVVLTVLLSAGIWIWFYGVPLVGLPKAENVQSVALTRAEGDTVVVTDAENVELLVKAANLLNYRFGTPEDGTPELTVTYTLTDGTERILSASHTTTWWKGRAHRLKEPEVFCNILEGLFFSGQNNDAKG